MIKKNKEFTMEEVKTNAKINETDIKLIQDLRLKFQNLSLQIGQIELQANNIKKQKVVLLNEYTNLQEDERKIADSFVQKYGEGQLNPNTWEFEQVNK
jgi:tRNA G10  N-methylase Trm11